MKKAITIIALALASQISKADHLSSSLTVSLYDHSLITLSVDERGFSAPGYAISADDLEPGMHFIRVARFNQTPGWYQPVHEYFAGYVQVAAQSEVTGIVTRQHRFQVVQIVPVFVPPVSYNYYNNNWNNGQYGHNNYTQVNNQCHENYLSDYEFDQWMNSIRSKSFESTKLEMARQMISSNNLLTRQVVELIREMTFESTKLEIAKCAYNKTVDRQNYFRVNDAFTFESSISELNEYIHSNQG